MNIKLQTGVSAEGVPCVGFEHNDMHITDPYVSECGRFATPHSYYGCPDELAFAMVVVNRYLKEAASLKPELEALGLQVIETGGGCTAWEYSGATHYIWVSDTMGLASDLHRNNSLLIGYYENGQTHSEQIDYVEGNWETIKMLIHEFIAGSWSPSNG